ncbi:hypothetical protein HD806DRAFT_534468 [Xylariaceae sp. AK1471]|nr:hypothetical protein HD806DRAFT_534468 [Xylariaceae sp. AK1471]
MQFRNSLIFGLSVITGIQAHLIKGRDVVVAHFTLHGGPASYELYVPTNGTVVTTGNGISVNIIDTPNYDAISLCTFNTPGPKALVGLSTPEGPQQIIVGPPQPILSVSCQAQVCPTAYRKRG